MKAIVLISFCLIAGLCLQPSYAGGRTVAFGNTDEELIGVWVDFFIVGKVEGYKNVAGRILTTGVLDYGKVGVTRLRKHSVERLYQSREAEWSCLSTVQHPEPHDCDTKLYYPINKPMYQCDAAFYQATKGTVLSPAASAPRLMSTSAALDWVSKRTNELINNGLLYTHLTINGGNRHNAGSLWYDIGAQVASASVDHSSIYLGDMVSGAQYALICVEQAEVSD
ncbi:hypothetical protein QO874_001126 [Salmonella enterica]|nr:hypothetical protein [Salmonella enterica]ELS7100790.1 hypothetical protein [Salmonella enterica]